MKKLTITVDDKVYKGLHKIIGKGKISRFLNDLARPHVVDKDLQEAYKQMAADEAREGFADEWGEAFISDSLENIDNETIQ